MEITPENETKLQSYMNHFHSDWDGQLSYREQQGTKEELVNKVVAVCKLNYQVENGGFYQWLDNGYGNDIKECEYIASLLEEVGTDSAKEVKGIVSRYVDRATDEEGELTGEDICMQCMGDGEYEDDCPDCDYENEDDAECETCGGSGVVEHICDNCGGSGKSSADFDTLDHEFYKINNQMLNDVADWLIRSGK